MKTVAASLSTSGLTSLNKFISDYQKKIEESTSNLVGLMADSAVEAAKAAYDSAPNAGPIPSISVGAVKKEKFLATVSASGDQLYFLEYGTGIRTEGYPASYPGGDPVTDPMAFTRGQFGNHNGANAHGWYYPVERTVGRGDVAWPKLTKVKGLATRWIFTRGQPAGKGMYNARKIAGYVGFAMMAQEAFK